MNKIENSELLKEIMVDFKKKDFSQALKKTKIIAKQYPDENIISRLFAKIYFNKMEWENAIKFYQKNLFFEKDKYKIYLNLGVALFNVGKINESIDAFKKSIKDNQNFHLAHNNLGISYIELGMIEEAIKQFVFVLSQNNNNNIAQSNLINLFNINRPINNKDHPLIEINNNIYRLKEVNENFNNDTIKKILKISNKLINNFKKDLYTNETQIFRKNSENLNCQRHFKVFNEFNIIPKYCFSCYKVQINLKTVVDLIKLFLIFDSLTLKNNNTRKCTIELREKVKGSYKGYIYCKGISEAENIKLTIQKVFKKENLNVINISIKHGCTEFYSSYPEFEEINYKKDKKFKYQIAWKAKENIIDSRDPQRIKADRKVWFQTINGINLSDILVINNWISYAYAIGDFSYKDIYDKKINSDMMQIKLKNQITFRKEEFKI